MSTTISQRHHPRTVAESLGGMRATKAGAIIGLVLLAVGSLAPWATFLAVSVNGTDGKDGKATLALAAIGLAALLLVGSRRAVGMAVFCVVVSGTVAARDLVRVERGVHHATLFGVHVGGTGWGLYAAIGGAIVALFALTGEYLDS